MTWKKIANLPQPSITAASSSSFGIPLINCMHRKIKNADPPK
jgi:hypothetical protein